MDTLLRRTLAMLNRINTGRVLRDLDDHMRADIGLPPGARPDPRRIWRVLP